MKWIMRFFAFLDLVSFILMFDQAYIQFNSFFTNESFTINEVFARFIFLLLWLSLLASAILLAIPKKAGIIIYYIQLIPRFIFLCFSVGLISSISYVITWQHLESVLMPVIIFAEMLRVYFSYKWRQEL